MGITLTSTSDTPAQVKEALESRGYSVEVVETKEGASASEVSAEQPVADKPAAIETPPASAEPPADKPGEAADKTADATGASSQEKHTPDAPPKRSGKKGIQERFSELTKEKHEARREADQLRAQLADMRAQLDAQQKGKPAGTTGEDSQSGAPAGKSDDSEPELNGYENYEDWAKEHAKWTVRQETKPLREEIARLTTQLREREEVEAAERATAPVLDAWRERLEQTKKAHGDYDQVFQQSVEEGLQVTDVMRHELMQLEGGTEVLYYLAKNPDECRRITDATLLGEHPTAQEIGRAVRTAAREFALIEQRLNTQDGAAQPPRSSGENRSPEIAKPRTEPPPPVDAVGARSAAATGPGFRESMSQREYREWRERQRSRH